MKHGLFNKIALNAVVLAAFTALTASAETTIANEKSLRKAFYEAPTDGTTVTITLGADITLETLYAADNFSTTETLADNAEGDTFNRYKIGVHPTAEKPDQWNSLVTDQTPEARVVYGAYYHVGATDERIARLVVKAGQKIVLDLNGHTIQKNARATHGDWSTVCTDIIGNYGTLGIVDNSTGTKGTVKGIGYTSCGGAVLHNYEGATMTVRGVNVDGNAAGMAKGTGQYVIANDGGTLTIDGANVSDTATTVDASLVVNTAGTVTITGNATLNHPTTKAVNVKGGVVNVESATIISDTYAIYAKGGEVNVNGLKVTGTGTLAMEGDTATVTKKSGVDLPAPVGFKWVENDGVQVLKSFAAQIGGTQYETLDEAFAALSSKNYTLTLLDENAWDAATPVYWAAGARSGYAATLKAALTEAYKANAGAITIVCRPGADVGTMTHGHVADDLTIYGNNAYISDGECDLEVDTYKFSRATGAQEANDDSDLEHDITITAYELDNLGVWAQRHTAHTVTVNLTDCDGKDTDFNGKGNLQRIYISGTTGVNNITLTGCDFITKTTAVYSNADGAIKAVNCSFTGGQVPFNINHKANGTQTVEIEGCTFKGCGDTGEWKQFAAPIRFVNSGAGTLSASVTKTTITDTVGANGDILLGDGRTGQKSNDVELKVVDTAASIQAQKPGYYGETVDETKKATATSTASGTLETSVAKLLPPPVAQVGETKYATLAEAIDAAKLDETVTLLADTKENVTIAKKLTLDLNGKTLNGGTVAGKPALTVTAAVTIKDSSEAQTGTIKREDTAANSGVSSHYVIDIQGKNGFLTFEGGKVFNDSGAGGTKGASLIRLGNDNVSGAYPVLTITGGTFTQDNFVVIKVDRGTLHLQGGTVNSANSYAIENWNNANIKGGTVNGTVSSWVYSTGAAFSKLTISGGEINGDVASVNYDNAADKQARVYVTGGTVTGTLGTYTYNNGLVPLAETSKATIEVTGGTFTKDPTKYVTEAATITTNEDGTFGVAKVYLAKIGETSYYTMDEAFKAVKDSETIVLLRDYTTDKLQNSGQKSWTLDLNSHTWTANIVDTDSAAFEINNPNVTLMVKNGTVVSSQLLGLIPSASGMSGTITYNNAGLVFERVTATANGHSGIETNGNNTDDAVTLKDSTLNVPNGYGIYFPSSGTLTIENSVITAKTMGVQVCSGSLTITDGSTIAVTGDAVAKTENDGAIEDGAAVSVVNRPGYKGLGNVTISGGTFTAKSGNSALKAYTWKDKAESAFDNGTIAVSGGTFSTAIDAAYCASGYIPAQNNDGTFGVKEVSYVAAIGKTKYATLAEAIAAAQDGETIKLLADVTEDVVVTKSITLDLNGKTLTNTNAGKVTLTIAKEATATVKNGSIVGGTGNYNIQNNGTATLEDVRATAGNAGSSMIDNWGTMTINSGTYTGGLDVVKSEEGSTLTINGGTFTLEHAVSGKYTAVILVYGDTTINGGEFFQNATTPTWANPQVVMTGLVEGYSATTKVTGGKFINKHSKGKIFHGLGKATSANFAVSGGTFNKKISDGFCADGFIPAKNADGTYGVKKGSYVAKVGSTKYETLADAIRLAAKGKTVTLLANVTENVTIEKKLTLDLNGFTLNGGTVKGKPALTVTAAVTVKDSSTAQTGTIKREDTAENSGKGSHYVIDIQGNGNLVFESGNVTNGSGAGGTKGASLVRVGGDSTSAHPVLTIKGGTFTQDNFIVVKVDDGGTLHLEGGTLTSANTYAIQNWNTANITGGMVKGAVSSWTYKGGANSTLTVTGGTINGDVISVNYGNVEGNVATVEIRGGTVNGKLDTRSYVDGNLTSIEDPAKATIAVSGGTFSNVVDKKHCAAGYVPSAKGADNLYGVTLSEVIFVNGEAKTLDKTAKTALEAVKSATGDGATVQYEVVNAATSTKVTAADVDDRTRDFATLPNGTYTLQAKVTKADETTETKTIVTVGVIQAAKYRTTILAVPFVDIDGQLVTVATLFNAKAAALANGDTLNVYDATAKGYVSFAYENGAWKDAGNTDAKDPAEFTLARGTAVRLDHTGGDATKIALVGTIPAGADTDVATEIPAQSVGLAVNVTTADKKVSAITTTGTADVNVYVPTADDNVQYVRQAGVWKKMVSVTAKNGDEYLSAKPVTDSDTIPAGTGYWVLNMQETAEKVK